MSGETDLKTLLRSLSAELHPDTFVFATIRVRDVPAGLRPMMVFQESEGTTLVLTKAEAEAHGMPHEFPCRMITLNIHSSLDAVGFIAHIASVLAAHDMGVNPVSGFYHDHLFVPEGKQEQAMQLLSGIAEGRL
ncbi:MAG: ACT domain-containing protein [Sulfitobacter sp.]